MGFLRVRVQHSAAALVNNYFTKLRSYSSCSSGSNVLGNLGVIKPGRFSYLSVPGDEPLSDKTLGQLVDSAGSKYGDSEGLHDRTSNSRLSFKQIKAESDMLAAGLLEFGFKKSDRVGVWGPNSRRWYITELALAKAGLISVFVNPAYQSRELLYCINKVGMKGIVMSGEHKTQNFYEILAQTVPELTKSSAGGKVKSEVAPTFTTVISMETTTPHKSVFLYDQLLDSGDSKEAQNSLHSASERVTFDDICSIQFTSGTTGNPKGVMLTHHNLVNNSYLVGKRFELNSKDKLCLPTPLFHCYGNTCGAITALHYGCGIVFPSEGFDPAAAVKAASEEKCTVMYGTPTMHIDMLGVIEQGKAPAPTTLRKTITAGAICPIELVKQMKSKYPVESVNSLYGLTETTPSYFQSLPGDSDEVRATTVGYPLEHTEVKIVDEKGQVVPVGTPGEMCVRGYMVMRGYWEDEAKTREAIDENRWFHSGDLFVMDPSGHARVVGRIKDMIIRGGENVYPREIEDFLHTHPAIMEAQVFGVPDERLGEAVAAWIRLKDGQAASLNEAEVKEFCKGQISHYKIPQFIKFTEQFPKTTSGKIQKYRMREIAMNELKL